MQAAKNKPFNIIHPGHIGFREYINEIKKYKNLIIIFAYQEIKVQYVQTKLNILWLVLKPTMVLMLFTFLFDYLIHIPNLKYPYPLFVFSGLIIWNNFNYMVNNAGNVLIANQHLIKKIYFPRIILLLSKTLVGIVELMVSIVLLLILIIAISYPVNINIIFLPGFILAGLISGMALAIWLNVLTARYRDLNQFVPTVIGFMIWVTPVFYPVSLIPPRFSFFLYLNPLVGDIQGCRWSILGDTFPSLWFLPSFIFSLIMLIAGFMIFIRTEDSLVDYI